MKDLERKTHYKLYKTHRGWLVAGLTVAGLWVGTVTGTGALPTAQAAETTPEVATQTVASELAGDQVTLTPAATEPEAPSSAEEADVPATDEVGTTPDVGTEEAPGDDATTSTPETVSSAESLTDADEPTPAADGTTNAVPDTVVAPVADANEPTVPEAGAAPVADAATPVADAAIADEAEAEATSFTVGIAPGDPSLLTDPVTGKSIFNISKDGQLQYTYDHTNAKGINSDLRVVDGYDPAYQTQGRGLWVGQTYADGIATTAKGEDVNSPLVYEDGSHPWYIDEWLPDTGLQYFLWENNFQHMYATMDLFRDNFTKADLATATNISTTEAKQSNGSPYRPTQYYYALMSMQTLEGLQNATNLETLYLYPDPLVSAAVFGSAMKNGNLWDIRALGPLENLGKVSITLFSVTDISALANKAHLSQVGLSYNQITDISPLTTDPLLDISKADLGFQHVLLKPITLNANLAAGNNVTDEGTMLYTSPSFIIKDKDAANLPIRGFNNDEQALYPSLYPSTADTGNLNANTLSWYNLGNDTVAKYGNLSTTWADTGTSFAGWILQPYALNDRAANVSVTAQLLQADGQQLTVGSQAIVTGEVDDVVNVFADANVQNLWQQQLNNGYTFTGLILDGTGLYTDYLAGNGLANLVTNWNTTLTEQAQNWTILFYQDVLPWNVTVSYGYQDEKKVFHPITDTDGTPITTGYQGTSEQELALDDYVTDFPDYVYLGAQTSTDGETWQPITDELIPVLGTIQQVQMLYAQAKRAVVTVVDATTGETVQTLDYQTNPELRGAIGTTSDFASAPLIDDWLAQGYVLVSDTTQTAAGTSAIVFTADQAAETPYTITLAHGFTTVTQDLTETVQYQDTGGTEVAKTATHVMSFATVTDQVTKAVYRYTQLDATAPLELDVTGQPTDAGWLDYLAGGTVTFAAITNPEVGGMHVLTTTDPANDLTQTTAQNVTATSEDLTFLVTYAHDFETVVHQVTEQISYVDQAGKPVAEPVTKTITFATVTDLSNDQALSYYQRGTAVTPELDENGQPTDAAWLVYTAGDQLRFDAVGNPAVDGMYVVSTTDPASDLTQTTAQTVTATSDNLAFVVTYAANPVVVPPVVTPPVDPPVVTPPDEGDGEEPADPDTDTDTGGDQELVPDEAGDLVNQPKKKAPAKTGSGGNGATGVKTNGQAADQVATGKFGPVQQLATGNKQQPEALADEALPQTDEQQNRGLSAIGLGLLGMLAGLVGWKKRQE